jgi:hypothetical protein
MENRPDIPKPNVDEFAMVIGLVSKEGPSVVDRPINKPSLEKK